MHRSVLAALATLSSAAALAAPTGPIMGSTLPLPSGGSGIAGLHYIAAPMYVTTEPATAAGLATAYNDRHRPEYGGALSGVGRLRLNEDKVTGFGTSCSGALLTGGMHVLTAAHCVTDASGALDVDLVGTNNYVNFPITSTGAHGLGNINAAAGKVAIQSVTVHPGWNGDYMFNGNDIAIITLANAAPVAAARYDIYTGGDEVGSLSTKSGWGRVGDGNTGASTASGWRQGQNVWDMNAQVFWDGEAVANPNILMYDFDNGLAANDAFGVYFGLTGLGLGNMEVLSSNGDSGGPSFIGGKVAGITSFGVTFTNQAGGICTAGNPDLICGLNNSFGEFAGDTRVSGYAAWINAQMGVPVPEPETYALMLAGLGLVGAMARRRRV